MILRLNSLIPSKTYGKNSSQRKEVERGEGWPEKVIICQTSIQKLSMEMNRDGNEKSIPILSLKKHEQIRN